MANYLDSLPFYLFFSYTILLVECYGESHKDQKLSIWDYIVNKKLDDILDKDRFEWKWPTLPPDIDDILDKDGFHREFSTISPGIDDILDKDHFDWIWPTFFPKKDDNLDKDRFDWEWPTLSPDIDDILDKDRFDREWPTISPDTDEILNKDRLDWEWPTHSPDILDYHKPQNNGLSHFPEILVFIVSGVVVIFFVLVCLYGIIYCFAHRDRESLNAVYARVGRSDSPPTYPRSPLSTIAESDGRQIVLEFSNPVDECSISTIDRPPRYDDVIRIELSGKGNFPEVHSSIPDTPPPEYDDLNAARY